MHKLHLLVAVAMLLGLSGASSAGIASFLSHYNVSAATISNLTYKNISYSGASYSLAYIKSTPTFLINTTGGSYAFVNLTGNIAPIITTTIINSSLNAINASYLARSMMQYNESSAQTMSDCLTETGLAQGYTCTLNNQCQSCSVVPVCAKAMRATNGPSGPLGLGIAQFQISYFNLKTNLSAYQSNVSTLSTFDAQSNLKNILSSFSGISSITSTLYQNALFPPSSNANFALCGNFGATSGNVPSSSGPWYCSSIGFCGFLSYNYSLLGNMQSYINHVSKLPVSQSQISTIAQNISNSENAYLLPVLQISKQAQLNGILNTTLKHYNATVTGASSLLTMVSNTMLSTQLNNLTATYTITVQNYLSANLVAQNATLKKQYAAVFATYNAVNTTYDALIDTAQDNTELLIDIQSGPGGASTQVSQVAFEQAQKNLQLDSKVTNITAQQQSLQSIRQKALSLSNPSSISEAIVRAIDAPVVTALAGGSSYSSAVGMAPFLALIPTIIIVAIILVAVFLIHRKLNAERKIHMTPRTARNWRILYILIAVLLLLYIIGTYLVAAAANGPAPLPVAAAAFNASKTVAIAINGTSNAYLKACEAQIKSTVLAQNKTALLGTINGASCNFGTTETTDRCLAYYASKGIPMVILSNSSINSLTAYSFYGTILSQRGNNAFTATCPASLIVSPVV